MHEAIQLGVCMAAKIDDIDYAVLAESLGYSHLWVADSQMIWSDCYATLALIASQTSTMKIGTGVAIAGTRQASVTAAAHATINRLAPGRVFCGIGTGNTAMRVMGHRPMPIAEFDAHLAELRTLLDGEEANMSWRGRDRFVRHLMPRDGFVNFEPKMPIYVSGFGPRAVALAAKHADGLVISVSPNEESVARVWARLQAAASDLGRAIGPENFLTATLTTMFVLDEGEAVDSARVREGVGAFAIAGLHYAYEQWRDAGRPAMKPRYDFWDDYVALVERADPERIHQRIHEGHNCWVVAEEEQFITKELIEASCLVGTPHQLADRLRGLRRAGLGQVMILPPLAVKEEVLRDVAAKVMPLL